MDIAIMLLLGLIVGGLIVIGYILLLMTRDVNRTFFEIEDHFNQLLTNITMHRSKQEEALLDKVRNQRETIGRLMQECKNLEKSLEMVLSENKIA